MESHLICRAVVDFAFGDGQILKNGNALPLDFFRQGRILYQLADVGLSAVMMVMVMFTMIFPWVMFLWQYLHIDRGNAVFAHLVHA